MKGLEKVLEIKGKKFLFRVEESGDHRDYLKYEELRNEVWAEPSDNMAGSRNMKCENFLHEGSSLFIGVFTEADEGGFKRKKEHLVGFCYGFVGIKDKDIAYRNPDNLQFYSQYTCVRKDFESLGLGVRIKEFQKEILVQIFGIHTVTCTYDPLTGINAFRNIHYFGMDVLDYREAYYGRFGGLLNRLDIPCDRFFVTWDLKKKVRRPEYDLNSLIESGCLAVEAEMTAVRGRSEPLELETVKNVNLDLDSEFLLIEIPVDFYRMLRETDVEDEDVRNIPLQWREKTREAFKTFLQRGYRIVDFRKVKRDNRVRDFYILKK
jgi:predicted GNAT superfamily acetyltransferase